MSLKLLADSYVELNIKSIKEITGENYSLCPEIKSENYIFLYCRQGSDKIIVDGKSVELSENDIYLININVRFSFTKGNYSILYLEFNGASTDDLLANSSFSKGNVFLHDDSHLGYYFYKIYHAYHEAEYLSLKCLGILYELFYELTKKNQINTGGISLQRRHVDLAQDYINQNYQMEITIADVAKKVGVTSNYLANIFATYLQKTPKAYLTEIRMEQAKKLLATHKYKIKEVGKLVGYKNQLHFSSEFKKYTGESPAFYAKDN